MTKYSAAKRILLPPAFGDAATPPQLHGFGGGRILTCAVRVECGASFCADGGVWGSNMAFVRGRLLCVCAARAAHECPTTRRRGVSPSRGAARRPRCHYGANFFFFICLRRANPKGGIILARAAFVFSQTAAVALSPPYRSTARPLSSAAAVVWRVRLSTLPPPHTHARARAHKLN